LLLSSTNNLLLNSLSSADLALVAPNLDPVTLKVRTDLVEPNRPIKAAYFIEEGIASVVAASKSRCEVEVGLIGSEGMSGIALIMGDNRSPNHTYMQVAGSGHRIAARDLRVALERSRSLHSILLKYAHSFLVLSTQTAVANGRAGIEARLARWLLMSQDRLRSATLPLTHEFISLMLGVRRAGVTETLQKLNKRRLLEYERGLITILDRKGLEEAANGFYGIPERELRRQLRGAD
jgi:CRP-like cAMP-binding protein